MKLTKDKRTDLEKLIDGKIEYLADLAEKPEEIGKVMELMTTRKDLGKKESQWYTNPQIVAAVIGAAGSILGIGLILKYEKLDIIATKAIGFVLRGRV